jgi:hypothetical protein
LTLERVARRSLPLPPAATGEGSASSRARQGVT